MLPLKVTRVASLTEGLVDTVVWQGRRFPVTRWRETLESALAPAAHFADDGSPAMVGDGRRHYLGFWPDPAFLDAWLAALCRDCGLPARALGDTLRLRRCGRLRFAFNYGAAPVEAPAPDGAAFVLGTRTIPGPGMAAWVED
jgi:beta-galactosidase